MPKSKRRAMHYHSREFLLSRNELAFFHALRRALASRFVVFAKVRLADVVGCSDELWNQEPGRKIAQKHLDFVVCEIHSSRIVAAVEVDDRSHLRAHRRQRDVFLNQLFRDAGVPLLRFPARAKYEPDELRLSFDDAARDPVPARRESVGTSSSDGTKRLTYRRR